MRGSSPLRAPMPSGVVMSAINNPARPRRSDFGYFHELRVRFSEIDYQGIVFNAHYFTYYDAAITEYLRSIDSSAIWFKQQFGLDFHLVKAASEYYRPIGLDALLQIGVRIAKIGNSSITWEPAIFFPGEDECRSRGEIVWVCAKPGTHRSHAIPDQYRQRLAAAT
jgi:acyl-CoA thioester hydrolase